MPAPASIPVGFDLILESAPDPMVVVDSDGRIALANRLAETLFGYSRDELLERPVEILIPTALREQHAEHRRRYSADPHVRPMGAALELHSRRSDGSEFPVEISLSPVTIDGSLFLVSAIRDVSERRSTEERLRYLADHDPLTGVRNRRRFQQDLAEQVSRARRYGEVAVLLVIDVDGFKLINDAHGHGAGDQALQLIAAALRERLRETDVVARIGGDEFAVLMPHAEGEQADYMADALRAVVSRSVVPARAGAPIRLAISVGMARIDRDSASDDAVLIAADRAMYRDKAVNQTDQAN